MRMDAFRGQASETVLNYHATVEDLHSLLATELSVRTNFGHATRLKIRVLDSRDHSCSQREKYYRFNFCWLLFQ